MGESNINQGPANYYDSDNNTVYKLALQASEK